MVRQKALFDGKEERRIVPGADRQSPAVWVAELRVLRELSKEEEHVVRRIPLRRGLNILWAREPENEQEKQLFEDSLSGHSAGKTTFCRFLRYVLGEPHFGDDQLRLDVRQAFPNGWVAGQVFVLDRPWAVFRPLAIGSHPFVVRDATLDEALNDLAIREPFDAYRAALDQTVRPIETVPRRGKRQTEVTWDRVLPWIARDQDCHFDGLVAWRGTSSDSGSPALDASDRHRLLRIMLGLISEKENRERRKNDSRNDTRKKFATRKPALQHQAAVDRTRLDQALGVELPDFYDGLFRDAATRELEKYETDGLAKLNQSANAITSQDVSELEDALRSAMQAEAVVKAKVEETTKSLEHHQQGLEALSGKMTDEKREEFFDSLGPSTGFCNVPMEMARAEGCPLAATRPIPFADRAAQIGIEAQIAQQKRVVEALTRQQASLETQLRPLTAAVTRALDAARGGRQRFAAHAEARASFKARVKQLRQLAQEAQRAWSEADALSNEDETLRREIERSYRSQDRLRDRLARDVTAFSERFNHFIAALLGESVEGKVGFSGREIQLNVVHRGVRRSSAIRIVTNIAFDLAALTSSLEGRGTHPRLLIHDGPRESDMSVGLYRKLFLLGQSLEQTARPSSEPGFQYIVTTTEAPPTSLQARPWLIEPVLDAADPKKRFLGVDL